MMAEFYDVVEHAPVPLFEVTEYPGVNSDICQPLIPVDLSQFYGEENDLLWKEAASRDNAKHHPSTYINDGHKGIYIYNEIKTLSGLRCDIPAGYPIILRGSRDKIDVPVQRETEKICLFGAVTYFDGYPVRGTFGETAAKVTLKYADGSTDEKLMRHGLEISSASLIARCSRLDARAVLSPRVAKITQDYDCEVYAMNLLAIPADESKVLSSISIEAVDENFEPVIYGISVL